MSILLEAATHVGALIVGALLHAFIGPPLARKLEEIVAKRARVHRYKKQLPDPPPEFSMYTLGNLCLPVMSLFGSPRFPLHVTDVRITFNPGITHESVEFPLSLRDAIPSLVAEYCAARPGKRLSDNPMPRYLGYTQAGETKDDERGEVTIHFGLTTFYTYFATNCSLDQAVIPGETRFWSMLRNRTIREAYVPIPYHVEGSPLANPLSSHCVVISRNRAQDPSDQLLVQRRGDKVALYRGFYQSSAAGYMTLAHRDESGVPNPFVTAVAEANQEIADRLNVPPSDFRMIGIAVNWSELDINAYGFVETGLATAELLGDTRRDGYEGWIEAIPFTPHHVLAHIASNRWEAMGAMAVCQVLLAFYPQDEVEAEAKRAPAKPWRAFCDLPQAT